MVSAVIHESSRTALKCALRLILEHNYVSLYSFERSMKDLFLRGKQKSLITNHAKLTLCKEDNQKCLLQSEKIMMFKLVKLQRTL